MKKRDALLKALNETGIVERMQKAANTVAKLDPETFEKVHDEVVMSTLQDLFHENEEILDLFTEYCFEIGMNSLVKELNIKPDPNYKPDAKERLALFIGKFISEM